MKRKSLLKSLLSYFNNKNQKSLEVITVLSNTTKPLGNSALSQLKFLNYRNIISNTKLLSWGKYIFAIGFAIALLDFLAYGWEWYKSKNKLVNTYGLVRRSIQLAINTCATFFIGVISIFSFEFFLWAFALASVWDTLVSLVNVVTSLIQWVKAEEDCYKESYKKALLDSLVRTFSSAFSAAFLIVSLIFKIHYIIEFILLGVGISVGLVNLAKYIINKYNANKNHPNISIISFKDIPENTDIISSSAHEKKISEDISEKNPELQKSSCLASFSFFEPLAAKERYFTFTTFAESKYKAEGIDYYKYSINKKYLLEYIKKSKCSEERIKEFEKILNSKIKIEKELVSFYLNDTKIYENYILNIDENNDYIKSFRKFVMVLTIYNVDFFQCKEEYDRPRKNDLLYDYRPQLETMSELEYIVELTSIALYQEFLIQKHEVEFLESLENIQNSEVKKLFKLLMDTTDPEKFLHKLDENIVNFLNFFSFEVKMIFLEITLLKCAEFKVALPDYINEELKDPTGADLNRPGILLRLNW